MAGGWLGSMDCIPYLYASDFSPPPPPLPRSVERGTKILIGRMSSLVLAILGNFTPFFMVLFIFVHMRSLEILLCRLLRNKERKIYIYIQYKQYIRNSTHIFPSCCPSPNPPISSLFSSSFLYLTPLNPLAFCPNILLSATLLYIHPKIIWLK